MNYSNKTREMKNKLIKIAANEYLQTPELNRSLTKLGEKYGIKRQDISSYLKSKNIKIINYQNIPRLNQYAFDSMDSEEQFYWLGFLYADGNISHTGNRLEVRLSIKDLEHLEKFKQFLNLSTEIRTGICDGNYFCHLSVRNKHIWNTLYNLGCIPRKTLILKFPNISLFKNNKHFLLHFIRGYIDGDGCLCIYKNKNGKTRTTISLVGTKKFVSSVNDIFKNFNGSIRSKTSKGWLNKAFELSFSDYPSRVIARLLYENATIYLTRKYNKYLYFCRLEEKSSLRKSSKIGKNCNVDTEISFEIAKGSKTLQSIESE